MAIGFELQICTKRETPAPELSMHKVSFAFPTTPEHVILKDFTLKIPPGKYVAIVGPAKSGKTCIVDLLDGLYRPTSGSVVSPALKFSFHRLDFDRNFLQIMDIWNSRDVKACCYRKLVGVVKQDPLFLDITLGENIAYGDLQRAVSKTEITEAAEIANIHHLIDRLPLVKFRLFSLLK